LASTNGRDPDDINMAVIDTRVVVRENSLGDVPALLRRQLRRAKAVADPAGNMRCEHGDELGDEAIKWWLVLQGG